MNEDERKGGGKKKGEREKREKEKERELSIKSNTDGKVPHFQNLEKGSHFSMWFTLPLNLFCRCG